ncbi:MAG: methyltransferase domain-containing protein [Burkholderiales bacterium]|nr:methyltransferase domain-containing protein [Burkholderiales bacterium]
MTVTKAFLCAICGSNEISRTIEYGKNPSIPDERLSIFKDASVSLCQNCGIGSIYPYCEPKDLEQFYINAYKGINQSSEPNIKTPVIYSRSASQYLDVRQDLDLNSKDILEIGPNAYGWALLADKFHASSYSYFDSLAISSIDALGAKYMGFLNPQTIKKIQTNSTDLIISSHSLEHLLATQINFTMEEFSRVIRPNGYLYIEVPLEIEAPKLNLRPPHTLFFSQSSLIEFLLRHGFRIARSRVIDTNHQSRLRRNKLVRGIFRLYRSYLELLGKRSFIQLFEQTGKAYVPKYRSIRVLAQKI